MKRKVSYNALLPALFRHTSQMIEIPVLIDLFKTEFGIEHFEYLGDGLFEVDSDALTTVLSVGDEDIDYLHKSISEGWHEIRQAAKK